MHKRVLAKPDGRRLVLYSRSPVPADVLAPVPAGHVAQLDAHLRWHPLRGEWVAYASHRQDRTFLTEHNPLAPTPDPGEPTELPPGGYDVAVFENRFPTLVKGPGELPDPAGLTLDVRPSGGACEVVVYGRDAHGALGTLPLDQIELVIEVWTDRYVELGARPDVAYVYAFENRGVEVGVTLHHPHGQIYAYPFVPPVAAMELSRQRAHLDAHGRGLLEDWIAAELADGRRMLYDGPHVVAFVPACARHTYEVWIAPTRAVPSFAELRSDERADLARALKTVLLKYDGLWRRPFPYVMAIHQAPTDGLEHPEAHLHFEFYPAYRRADRLKYLAGSELGAGVYTYDAEPEEKAAELRAVEVDLAG